MKLIGYQNYFPDTDSLYIDLSHKQSTESQEVSEGVVLDYDAEGNLVGIDIDHASQKLNLRELVTNHIPLEAERLKLNPSPSRLRDDSNNIYPAVTGPCANKLLKPRARSVLRGMINHLLPIEVEVK